MTLDVDVYKENTGGGGSWWGVGFLGIIEDMGMGGKFDNRW